MKKTQNHNPPLSLEAFFGISNSLELQILQKLEHILKNYIFNPTETYDTFTIRQEDELLSIEFPLSFFENLDDFSKEDISILFENICSKIIIVKSSEIEISSRLILQISINKETPKVNFIIDFDLWQLYFFQKSVRRLNFNLITDQQFIYINSAIVNESLGGSNDILKSLKFIS